MIFEWEGTRPLYLVRVLAIRIRSLALRKYGSPVGTACFLSFFCWAKPPRDLKRQVFIIIIQSSDGQSVRDIDIWGNHSFLDFNAPAPEAGIHIGRDRLMQNISYTWIQSVSLTQLQKLQLIINDVYITNIWEFEKADPAGGRATLQLRVTLVVPD